GVEGDAAQDIGTEGVEAVLHRGDHAEVAASSAKAPEEVCVLRLAGFDHLSRGGDHLGGDQVVAAQSPPAHQPADPTTEGETGESGGGRDAHRRGQSIQLRLVIDVAEGAARLHAHHARLRVDMDAAHAAEVADEAAVAQCVPGDVVAAASDRQQQSVLAGHAHPADDVGDT